MQTTIVLQYRTKSKYGWRQRWETSTGVFYSEFSHPTEALWDAMRSATELAERLHLKVKGIEPVAVFKGRQEDVLPIEKYG